MKFRHHFIFPVYNRNASNAFTVGVWNFSQYRNFLVSVFGINKCKTFFSLLSQTFPVVWCSTPPSPVLKDVDPSHLRNLEEALFSALLCCVTAGGQIDKPPLVHQGRGQVSCPWGRFAHSRGVGTVWLLCLHSPEICLGN